MRPQHEAEAGRKSVTLELEEAPHNGAPTKRQPPATDLTATGGYFRLRALQRPGVITW